MIGCRLQVRAELEGLAQAHPDRFKIWYTVDRPNDDWPYSSGFITAEMIQVTPGSINKYMIT